jgi:antitoxin YobK
MAEVRAILSRRRLVPATNVRQAGVPTMPMTDYDEATQLVANHPDLADFAGPRDEALVRAAEETLGVQFPPSYRRFLRKFGAGSFGGQEVYGVIDADFEHSSIPDAVWNTLSLRRSEESLRTLSPSNATGDGQQLCVQSGSSETPMPAIWPGSGDEPEVVASDFGVWFKEIVEGEIADR